MQHERLRQRETIAIFNAIEKTHLQVRLPDSEGKDENCKVKKKPKKKSQTHMTTPARGTTQLERKLAWKSLGL